MPETVLVPALRQESDRQVVCTLLDKPEGRWGEVPSVQSLKEGHLIQAGRDRTGFQGEVPF